MRREVKEMNRKINNVFSLFLCLVLITVTLPFICTSVLAKDLNLPPGADRIVYFSRGNASINLPAGLPNYYSTATKIGFYAFSVERGTMGAGAFSLYVALYMKTTANPNLHWEPIAFIETSAENANFHRMIYRGTYIAFDATLYGIPSTYNTTNVILVDQGVLKVERHGNDINVNLNAPQQIKKVGTTNTFFTLPPFNLELNNYGGSVHFEKTNIFSGYPGASGYTEEAELIGFQANGAFTCTSPGWSYNAVPVTESFIVMHGIITDYPPP
jgi:hypothetical protein